MKTRTRRYFKKNKARSVFNNVLDVDLNTFLSAAMELSNSRTVKKHVQKVLYRLDSYKAGVGA